MGARELLNWPEKVQVGKWGSEGLQAGKSGFPPLSTLASRVKLHILTLSASYYARSTIKSLQVGKRGRVSGQAKHLQVRDQIRGSVCLTRLEGEITVGRRHGGGDRSERPAESHDSPLAPVCKPRLQIPAPSSPGPSNYIGTTFTFHSPCHPSLTLCIPSLTPADSWADCGGANNNCVSCKSGCFSRRRCRALEGGHARAGEHLEHLGYQLGGGASIVMSVEASVKTSAGNKPPSQLQGRLSNSLELLRVGLRQK